MVRRYAKNPVGAHYGLAEWLLQRLTAIVMVLYTVGLGASLLAAAPASYADWRALFSGSFMRLATMFFVAALLYHAWVGMRDVWMDYVKSVALRLVLQVLTMVWLVACLGWSIQVLWRL